MERDSNSSDIERSSGIPIKSYLLIFKVNQRSSTIALQAADDEAAKVVAANILRDNAALAGELATPNSKNSKELHSLGIVKASLPVTGAPASDKS